MTMAATPQPSLLSADAVLSGLYVVTDSDALMVIWRGGRHALAAREGPWSRASRIGSWQKAPFMSFWP